MSTIFHIYASGSTPGGTAAGIRPHVVVAEDHSIFTRTLLALLSGHCEIVAAVGDGRELVEAAQAHRPDVIITDIDMPVMTGFEAARIILAEQPQIPILFVSAFTDPVIIRYALGLGALGYVWKGDAARELLTAVGTILNGSRYVSTVAQEVLARRSEPDPDNAA